jgi:hypothetical protein
MVTAVIIQTCLSQLSTFAFGEYVLEDAWASSR